MKKNYSWMVFAAIICIASGIIFNSCKKLEDDLDGMNDGRAWYSYHAQSPNSDYAEATGRFDTAIRFSVGMESIQGGADEEVIKACDAVYNDVKETLNGKKVVVHIIKTRHPDGRTKIIKTYKF